MMHIGKEELENNGLKYFITVLVSNPANGKTESLKGIVDTGSTHCGLNKSVIERLGLQRRFDFEYLSIDGLVRTPGYFATIMFLKELKLRISETPLEYDDCDLIIGMDFLKEYDITINKGNLTISL